MSETKTEMEKRLAVLAQVKEELPPLEDTEKRIEEVAYITKENQMDLRKVCIYIPNNFNKPLPLIYIPHYEMTEDSVELREYLKEGWAVASPTEAPQDYNSRLSDDDLTFNNAALYALRRMDEFDPKRIALVGGSAGGYMTLMLMGQNLGLCCAIANSPITNLYFNIKHYFNYVQQKNMLALATMSKESENEGKKLTPAEIMQKVKDLPVPLIAALGPQFLKILENFPDLEDTERWEAHTAVGIADRFSNPLVVNHCTSDVLVPVDQITRRYTYKKAGASLSDDFNALLPADMPGKLHHSLEEVLPEKEMRCEKIGVTAEPVDILIPFDSHKQFNINIFDDGPVEGYGAHTSRMQEGRYIVIPYLKEMFGKSAAETVQMTPAMLEFLLKQYEGKSIALPARCANETVYGSETVYREKVKFELNTWLQDHSLPELDLIISHVSEPDNAKETLKGILEKDLLVL